MSGSASHTLGDLYSEALARLKTFQDSGLHGNDPEAHKLAQEAFAALAQAHRSCDAVSENEELPDIATRDLRFLLLPSQLGVLSLEMPGPFDSRPERVRRGCAYLRDFLRQLQRLGLLGPAEREFLKRAEDLQYLSTPPTRDQKIAEFRREQAVAKRLQELAEARETRLARRRERGRTGRIRGGAIVGASGEEQREDEEDSGERSSGISAAAAAAVVADLGPGMANGGGDEDEDAQDPQVDADAAEEQEREYWLAALADAALRAVGHLRFAARELQMVEMHARMQAAQQQRPPHQQQQQQLQNQMQRLSLSSQSQSQASQPQPSQTGSPPPPQPSRSGRPLAVHHFRSSKDLAKPIPEHMREFMIPIQPASVPGSAQAGAVDGEDGQGQKKQPMSREAQLRAQSGAAQRQAEFQARRPLEQLMGGPAIAGVASLDAQIARRAQAQSQVFREYNPPTKGMAEWFAEEQAAGCMPSDAEIAAMQRQQQQRSARRGSDDDDDDEAERRRTDSDEEEHEEALLDRDYDLADQQTMEAREWDNWKDDNERGIGNRMK